LAVAQRHAHLLQVGHGEGGGVVARVAVQRGQARRRRRGALLGRVDGLRVGRLRAAQRGRLPGAALIEGNDAKALRQRGLDITILSDRQPYMDNFVGGVWDDYRLTEIEASSLRSARRLHTVLVEGAIAELERLGAAGALAGIEVSADFLGFRHYTVERLAATMRHVDLGIVGWPGAEDHPTVDGMRRVANDLGRLLVVTMGARAVHVFDGRPGSTERERRYPVTAVPVAGTTLGCGDAFIAWFLDAWWRTRDLDAAVAQGLIGGAQTAAWPPPPPDDAYEPAPPMSPEGAS